MARSRTLHPGFFTDGDLYDAEAQAGLPLMLAYAGLWCLADREGRFEWKPRELKLHILPYHAVDFAAVMEALAHAGFIVRYAVDGREYGYIPTFLHYQKIHPREAPSRVPEPPQVDEGSPKARPRYAQGTPKAASGESLPRASTSTSTSTSTSDGDVAREGAAATALKRDMPPEYLPALDGALKSARNPDALVAEIGMLVKGARGLPAPTLADVGLALHDMQVGNVAMTANALRAFVRKARDGAGQLRGPPESTDDVIQRAEAIQAHHAAIRNQRTGT